MLIETNKREAISAVGLPLRTWATTCGAPCRFYAGSEEYVAEVGDFVFKPRGEGHTFFNASDEPARMLELISPGGLEEAFKIIGTAAQDTDLGPLVAPFGCEADMEATTPIVERFGLTFG